MKKKVNICIKYLNKYINYSKSFLLTGIKLSIVSVLLFSSINIIPLITNQNVSNSVEAAGACDPTASGLPQWATSGYSFTRERYKSCVTNPAKTVSIGWVLNQGVVLASITFSSFLNPFIGNDGTVYSVGVANSGARYLVALKSDKTLKWIYALVGHDYSTAAFQQCNGRVRTDIAFDIVGLTPNGDIVIGGQGTGCKPAGGFSSAAYYEERIKDNVNSGVHVAGFLLNDGGNDINTNYTNSLSTLSPDGTQIAIHHYGNPTNPYSYNMYDTTKDYINLTAVTVPQGRSPGKSYYAQPDNSDYTASYPTPLAFRFTTNPNTFLQSGGSNKYSEDTLNGDSTNNQAFTYYGEGDTGAYSYARGVGTQPNNYDRNNGLWSWVTPGGNPGDPNAVQGCSNNVITTYVPSWGRTTSIYSGRVNAGRCQTATIKVTNLEPNFTYNGVVHSNNRNQTQAMQNDYIIGVDKTDPANPKLVTEDIAGGNVIQRYNMTNGGAPVAVGSWPQSGSFSPGAFDQFQDYIMVKGVLYYTVFANAAKTQIRVGALDLNNNLAPLLNYDPLNQALFPSTQFYKSTLAVADDGSIYLSTGIKLIKLGPGAVLDCSTATVTSQAPSVTITTPTQTENMVVTAKNVKNAVNVSIKAWSIKGPGVNGNTDLQTYAAAQDPLDITGNTWIATITPMKNHVLNNGNNGFDVGTIDIEAWAQGVSDPLPVKCSPTGTFYANQLPIGKIESNTCQSVSGYVFDKDKTDNATIVPVKVNIYKGITALTPLLYSSAVNIMASGTLASSAINTDYPSPSLLGYNHIFSDSNFATNPLIKDGQPHLVTVTAYDTYAGSASTTTITGTTITCFPDPWFNVLSAQSFSYSGFKSTINGFNNNSDTPPTTAIDKFTNASVLVKSPVLPAAPAPGFYGTADGVSNVSSYQSNAIQNYVDNNSNPGNAIFSNTNASYASVYPKTNYINVATTPTAGFNTVGNLSIDLNNVAPNTAYVFTDATNTQNVSISYDLLNTTTKSGIGLYIFGVQSISINVNATSLAANPLSTILLFTDADVTVTAPANNVFYFNMGIVSGKSVKYSQGGNIIYKCAGYVTGDAVGGCRIIQSGFSYAENKVAVKYKNTTNLGVNSMTTKPALQISYNPNYLVDFTKQLSFYGFTTDLLGFTF